MKVSSFLESEEYGREFFAEANAEDESAVADVFGSLQRLYSKAVQNASDGVCRRVGVQISQEEDNQ